MQLGTTGKDRITGFTGTVTAFAQYISGCHQVLLTPKLDYEGGFREPQWFDVQRVERTDGDVIVLDNGTTPGCDRAAPVR